MPDDPSPGTVHSGTAEENRPFGRSYDPTHAPEILLAVLVEIDDRWGGVFGTDVLDHPPGPCEWRGLKNTVLGIYDSPAVAHDAIRRYMLSPLSLAEWSWQERERRRQRRPISPWASDP